MCTWFRKNKSFAYAKADSKTQIWRLDGQIEARTHVVFLGAINSKFYSCWLPLAKRCSLNLLVSVMCPRWTKFTISTWLASTPPTLIKKAPVLKFSHCALRRTPKMKWWWETFLKVFVALNSIFHLIPVWPSAWEIRRTTKQNQINMQKWMAENNIKSMSRYLFLVGAFDF